MQKIVLVLLFLFSDSAVSTWTEREKKLIREHFLPQKPAEIYTDEEKIKMIRSVAKTYDEPQVFYRWQSEDSKKGLLKAGQMTPQLHQYFNSPKREGGLFVSENIYSSALFNPHANFIKGGTTLVQVEVEKGVKYIDLEAIGKLQEMKVSQDFLRDLFHLDHGLIVPDLNDVPVGVPHWNIKLKEGVRFKPFDVHSVPLEDLNKIEWRKTAEDHEALKKEMRKRIQKEGHSYFDFPFSVTEADFKDIDSIRLNSLSFEKGNELLEEINSHLNLSKEIREKATKEVVVQLVEQNVRHAEDVLKLISFNTHYAQNMFLVSPERELFSDFNDWFDSEKKEIKLQKANVITENVVEKIPELIRNLKTESDIMYYLERFSLYKNKGSHIGISINRNFTFLLLDQYLSPQAQQEMIDYAFSQIKTKEGARRLFNVVYNNDFLSIDQKAHQLQKIITKVKKDRIFTGDEKSILKSLSSLRSHTDISSALGGGGPLLLTTVSSLA